MKSSIIPAALVAGVLTWSTFAIGQTTAVPAAPDAAVGGQASTKTQAGVPNPTQKPDSSAAMSREEVRTGARVENRSPANTVTPKGEPSTMTNNQPNAAQPTGALTRAEVKPTSRELKPQAGKVGERPDVPTNPTEKTGTPK